MSNFLNKVNPSSNCFPWGRLRDFINKHDEIFTPNTYTQLKIHIIDETSDPTEYRADIAFCNGSDGRMDIYGEVFGDGVLARLAIDPDNETGEMQIPNFQLKVDIENDEAIAHAPEWSHPDVYAFAENYLKIYWKVLNFIADEEDIVREKVGEMMLKKYPWRYN